MRIQETKVYTYDELSDEAKEKARDWYRDGALDYDWWDGLYEDFAQRAEELGIDLRKNPFTLRNEPEINFSGFYCQGSGSSFAGTWSADKIQGDKLREECPTETELHRILSELESIAKEDPGMSATINTGGDNWINIEVCDGEEASERLNELEYESGEYKNLSKTYREREDDLIQTLRDFNHWIYQGLQKEYEWLNADEQVEESIRANKYEFTEDGNIHL